MVKPLEKASHQPLVHHPSSVLDSCGRYDATNENWRRFDDRLTAQIYDFEAVNQRYFHTRRLSSRRRAKG